MLYGLVWLIDWLKNSWLCLFIIVSRTEVLSITDWGLHHDTTSRGHINNLMIDLLVMVGGFLDGVQTNSRRFLTFGFHNIFGVRRPLLHLTCQIL